MLQQLNFEMNPRVPGHHDVATCTILMQANAYGHPQLKQKLCAGTCTEDVLQWFKHSHATVHPQLMNSK